MRIAANISLLFADLPLPARFAAAAGAGFEGVEIQFPYDHDASTLAQAAQAAGMPVVLINIPAGDIAGGDVGLGALPDRRAEFRAAVQRCIPYARALGVQRVNILSGRPGAQADRAVCHATLVENLRHAAEAFAPFGIRVLVEPVNPFDVPGFFLDSLDAALRVLDDAAHPNAGLQFDLYHMARTEPDLPAAIARAGARIAHVQFADTPGRHEPFSGAIDFAAAVAALDRAGYADWFAAEYRPLGATADGIGWLGQLRDLLAPLTHRPTPSALNPP
ncbi:hydroxypyruvate isomerase [Falsiroseomonas bella]|uniref:Hydroxypyruvate isomerase n=1 Tax=Falsiroseomonas bella TaxID=2184016 RepID=A0A317F8W1_9PROT|nr:TIM barrel protein [Falsiroseomonas bella]PWS35580.1 hydroxypyruvate isomerase [Falsiroseomonas bella]